MTPAEVAARLLEDRVALEGRVNRTEYSLGLEEDGRAVVWRHDEATDEWAIIGRVRITIEEDK